MTMNTIPSAPAPQETSPRPWGRLLLVALKRLWVAYITWRMEHAATVQLWSASDRTLKDMGLTRSEISGAAKGKWPAERGAGGRVRTQRPVRESPASGPWFDGL
jgi:uncharacterized protein YjiS (DUF1127 family)